MREVDIRDFLPVGINLPEGESQDALSIALAFDERFSPEYEQIKRLTKRFGPQDDRTLTQARPFQAEMFDYLRGLTSVIGLRPGQWDLSDFGRWDLIDKPKLAGHIRDHDGKRLLGQVSINVGIDEEKNPFIDYASFSHRSIKQKKFGLFDRERIESIWWHVTVHNDAISAHKMTTKVNDGFKIKFHTAKARNLIT